MLALTVINNIDLSLDVLACWSVRGHAIKPCLVGSLQEYTLFCAAVDSRASLLALLSQHFLYGGRIME